ncbi:MAG: hypothetical protein Q8Q02_10810 [Nocardioides sp.]|nr:hypothetical protein [Nocardioides sp.]
MKKLLAALALSAAFVLGGSTMASAAPGGMPAVHGVDGKTFGSAVSGLAKSDPAALVQHVTGR